MSDTARDGAATPGRATPAGTAAYRDRFADGFDERYFRPLGEWTVSSLGLGTYLGPPRDEVDEAYREAIRAALEGGVNLLDTAVNYRRGRSERVVGEALRAADVPRESVVVATKGGYLPVPESAIDPIGAVEAEYVGPGVVDREDLAGGTHAMSPSAIDWMLNRSLESLGLEAVDLYYLHNPEEQLAVRSTVAVYDGIEAAFRRLEEHVAAGRIGRYGVASWEAFRVPRGDDRYLSIAEVVERAEAAAEAAGAAESHLAAIQLPFNPLAGDALTRWEQDCPEGDWHALGAAERLGLSVVTSATLAQGRLIGEMPEEVAAWFDGDTTAQRAINFARSAPGVASVLVGMSSADHVWENVRAGRFGDMGSDAFEVVFEADR